MPYPFSRLGTQCLLLYVPTVLCVLYTGGRGHPELVVGIFVRYISSCAAYFRLRREGVFVPDGSTMGVLLECSGEVGVSLVMLQSRRVVQGCKS